MQCISLKEGFDVEKCMSIVYAMQPNDVMTDCNKVLESEPKNVKALFRRGQAHKVRMLLYCLDVVRFTGYDFLSRYC